MRLLVVGAGATGGYFGGRLAQNGRDVTFLVRSKRAEQLRRGGLAIVSPHGDVTLTPKIVTAQEIDGPYDAVLVTVKAFALESSMEDFAPAVGPQTAILPVLNGMRQVEVLSGRFGREAVAGCVCRVATTLDADGRIIQLAPFQDLLYGEFDGSTSQRMETIDGFMKDAGFNAVLSATIERDMWEKWLLLATMGGITCLMRGNIGEIEAVQHGTEFVLEMLEEVVRTVTTVGKAPTEKHLAFVRTMLTAKKSPQASSMYRDLVQGLPVEADQIIGDLVHRATAAGVKTPLLRAAYANLCIYQNRLLPA